MLATEANDVAKMHNLLGEPLDEDETVRMMSFFMASSPSTHRRISLSLAQVATWRVGGRRQWETRVVWSPHLRVTGATSRLEGFFL